MDHLPTTPDECPWLVICARCKARTVREAGKPLTWSEPCHQPDVAKLTLGELDEIFRREGLVTSIAAQHDGFYVTLRTADRQRDLVVETHERYLLDAMQAALEAAGVRY